MKKQVLPLFLSMGFVLGSVFSGFGQMVSENYRITSSAISSGGAPMASEAFQINSTLGQSSPLETDPPAQSEFFSYDLYPGFWFTLDAGINLCDDPATFSTTLGTVVGDSGYSIFCDKDGDGDVDGIDLAIFAADLGL